MHVYPIEIVCVRLQTKVIYQYKLYTKVISTLRLRESLLTHLADFSMMGLISQSHHWQLHLQAQDKYHYMHGCHRYPCQKTVIMEANELTTIHDSTK